jgi:hypothetical protein
MVAIFPAKQYRANPVSYASRTVRGLGKGVFKRQALPA